MKKILFLISMLLVTATARSMPFEPTPNPTAPTTKWYQIKTQDNWYLYYYNGIVCASSTSTTDDKYLWCFVGNESTGYTIYNRAYQYYMGLGNCFGTYSFGQIDHVEWDDDNCFYIYYEDSSKHYLVFYHSGPTNLGYRDGSFSAVEVETTPLVTVPYNTLAPIDFYIPHNALSNTGNEGYAKLIDQDKNTKWCVENNSGAWETIWLDFESDVWFIPKGYTLTTGKDTHRYPNRNPKEWILYGKTFEDDEWTELAHVTDGGGLEATSAIDYSFDITGATEGYHYFRFEVRQIKGNENNNYIFQLAELQLRGTYVEEPASPTSPNLPFVPTTDPSLSTTKWYQITVTGQYLFYDSSIDKVNVSSSPSDEDNYLWCFVGEKMTGYKIYNRGRQGYMRRIFNANGTGGEEDLNYVELDSADIFYIYYMDNIKWYLVYDSSGNIFGGDTNPSSCKALDPNEPPLPAIPGDVTGDGEVDIADVNAIINMMLGKATQTDAGDVTGDGEVDIADVNAVINIMLGKTTPVTPPEVDPTPQTLTAIGYNIPHNALDNEGSEGYAKLVDGDKTTKWCVENRSGSWETIWIDLKSNVAFKPTSYILTTGNDTQMCPTRNPRGWKIYGRNNENESWTELAHVTSGGGMGYDNTTDYTFEFNGITKAYQYYRFEVIKNGGSDHWNSSYYVFQLGELTLVGY